MRKGRCSRLTRQVVMEMVERIDVWVECDMVDPVEVEKKVIVAILIEEAL